MARRSTRQPAGGSHWPYLERYWRFGGRAALRYRDDDLVAWDKELAAEYDHQPADALRPPQLGSPQRPGFLVLRSCDGLGRLGYLPLLSGCSQLSPGSRIPLLDHALAFWPFQWRYGGPLDGSWIGPCPSCRHWRSDVVEPCARQEGSKERGCKPSALLTRVDR